jgi:large subunit ribosomal protein L24
MIALKGPLDAPKRTIDVAALASWLALRAVEQQSKKLDVLEGREPPPSPPKSEAAPAVPASPAGALPEAAPSTASDTPTPRARPTEFRSPSVNGQPNGAARAKPPTAPAAGQLAPLPPPVDIRPAPGSRTRALNGPAQGAVRLPQPSPPKPLAITPPLGGRVGELN